MFSWFFITFLAITDPAYADRLCQQDTKDTLVYRLTHCLHPKPAGSTPGDPPAKPPSPHAHPTAVTAAPSSSRHIDQSLCLSHGRRTVYDGSDHGQHWECR
jgi:hypothetical protein